jgi:hypothetical protein
MTKDKQRERLVDLLCNIPKQEVTYFGRSCGKTYSTTESIADYLLANGIIAPPYKICETLYLVFNNKVIQATVKEITKTNTGLYYKVETEFGLMLRATAACLCLTREEAEEKIKKEKE